MVTKLRLVETREEALNRLARLAQKRGIRILTYPLTGEQFALSLSHPETVHRVNRLGCDCLGFTYHNRCTHYAALLDSLGELPPERPGSPAAPAQVAVPVVLCDACDEVMATSTASPSSARARDCTRSTGRPRTKSTLRSPSSRYGTPAGMTRSNACLATRTWVRTRFAKGADRTLRLRSVSTASARTRSRPY